MKMKLDPESLRRDLAAYFQFAKQMGLPIRAEDPDSVDSADEAKLVEMAADQGIDLGKYIEYLE